MEAVLRYFGLEGKARIAKSSSLGIEGRNDQRVLAVVKSFGGDCYITGHGARKYLDHELFAVNGVRVDYIDYLKSPYPQLHGPFNPFVSILDLIANCGREGILFINSGTLPWKKFLSTYPEKDSP